MSVFFELSTLLSFYVLLFGELRFIFFLRLFLFLPSPLLFEPGASQRYDNCSIAVFFSMAGARNEMLYIALCRRLGNQCIGSSHGPSCSFLTHFILLFIWDTETGGGLGEELWVGGYGVRNCCNTLAFHGHFACFHKNRGISYSSS